MAKVVVSREARNDLIRIQNYIRDELQSPDASRRILGELKKRLLGCRTCRSAANRSTAFSQCILSIGISFVSVIAYSIFPMAKPWKSSEYFIPYRTT